MRDRPYPWDAAGEEPPAGAPGRPAGPAKPSAVARRGAATALATGENVDALPVLGAIREFIEEERLRARRALRRVLAVFAILTVAVVAVGGTAVYTMFGRVRRDAAQERRRMRALAEGMDRKIQDGGRQVRTALAGVRVLDHKITNACVQVDVIREAVRDNVADMKQDLVMARIDLESRWGRISNRVEELMDENASLRAELEALRIVRAASPPEPPYAAARPFLPARPEWETNTEPRASWRLPGLAP